MVLADYAISNAVVSLFDIIGMHNDLDKMVTLMFLLR